MSRPDPVAPSRRAFLRLGAAFSAGLAGCASTGDDEGAPAGEQRWTGRPPTDEENLEVWRAGAGNPYEAKAPGVCPLPGPNKKTRFPDPDKYKNVERIHGMCQLCSTVCGITGIVKDGRIEDVRVTRHREKQYYSSITDTPKKIVERQSVAGIDATSSATITSEAIINATAKALADGLK